MNPSPKLLFATLLALGSGLTLAQAAGSLAISSVSKSGTTLSVTGTCVQGSGPVKVWISDVSAGTLLKVYTTTGQCGAAAAASGKTVSFSVAAVPPGNYKVYLKQAGATSAPSSSISLP